MFIGFLIRSVQLVPGSLLEHRVQLRPLSDQIQVEPFAKEDRAWSDSSHLGRAGQVSDLGYGEASADSQTPALQFPAANNR